uniref:C-type lectin domain-containing protein n=1 Tax=Oncorhynchus mykiss TaxID=8022 RepID=A0A8K9UT21_ONCMY
MGHSLFLLFFSGLSILPSCLSHQFHFVNINKTWTEAQSYCRQNHTDLASIDDLADMNRLKNTVNAELLTEPAWIGLYNTSWRWSLEDTELGTVGFWEKGQPDNGNNNESCVWMRNWLWHDANCGKRHHFVCYGEFPCHSSPLSVISPVSHLHCQSSPLLVSSPVSQLPCQSAPLSVISPVSHLPC